MRMRTAFSLKAAEAALPAKSANSFTAGSGVPDFDIFLQHFTSTVMA